MKTRTIIPGLLVLLPVLVGGCGGSSGGGGRRLSDVVAEDEPRGREAQREPRTRGDETRTRTDHTERDHSASGNDGSGSVVGWLFSALFSGGDDDDDQWEDGREYQEYGPSSPYVEGEAGGADRGAIGGPSLSVGRFSLGYRHSWSHLAGDAIEGFETGMITAGFGPGDGVKFYLGGFHGHGDFGRSGVAAALDDLIEEGPEVGIRMYPTPDHTLLGSYFKLGGRIGSLDWKYRAPEEITTPEGGVTRVTEDYVFMGGPSWGRACRSSRPAISTWGRAS